MACIQVIGLQPHRWKKPKGMTVIMKINEVEQAIGITKKNIRFYEQEGLLNPSRNLSNGYRDYSEEDLETLRQIKSDRSHVVL